MITIDDFTIKEIGIKNPSDPKSEKIYAVFRKNDKCIATDLTLDAAITLIYLSARKSKQPDLQIAKSLIQSGINPLKVQKILIGQALGDVAGTRANARHDYAKSIIEKAQREIESA